MTMFDAFGSFMAMSVANTLLLAFFVVCAIGVAGSVYAAKAFKKTEAACVKKED